MEEFKLQYPEKFNGNIKQYIEWIFKTNGLKSKNINNYCFGFQLIRINVSNKKTKSVVSINAVGPVTDWYITEISNLGGR